jgi:hypothetical protein
MEQIRCKVKCTETGLMTGDQHKAKFSAVYNADPNSENGKFFKYTPSLSLDLGIIKNQHFAVDKEYYLDFTPVEG